MFETIVLPLIIGFLILLAGILLYSLTSFIVNDIIGDTKSMTVIDVLACIIAMIVWSAFLLLLILLNNQTYIIIK